MIIFSMRRILPIIIALSLLPLNASIVPRSESIGTVLVNIEDDSSAQMVLKAFSEEYTQAWLDSYAASDELFALAYTDTLSKILPMSNMIASSDRNTVTIYSLNSKTTVSVILENNTIVAVSLKEQEPQNDPEET